MPGKLGPWWVYVVAASYLAYFALLFYCALRGPGEPGITAEFEGGRMLVRGVLPNSPAERAGVQPGDRVVVADGSAIRTRFDWMAVGSNWEPDRPARLEIERGGKPSQVALAFPKRSWADWGASGALVGLVLWGFRLATLLLALLIVFRRPQHLIARVGAWFMATAAVSAVVVLPGTAVTWRHLPALLGGLLWIPALSTFSLAAIFFTFFALFPRSAFRRRWIWALVWIPALVELRWLGGYLYSAVYQPERAVGMLPDWILPVFSTTFLAYLAGGIAVLGVNYGRLREVSERRRMRLLGVGAVVGWLAVLPLVVFDWWGSASSLGPAFFSSPVALLAAALFLACLLSLSYALLRKRVFGIGVMIRQGLQYALARRVLLSLAPALGVLLIIDLLVHGDQPLMGILQARGWIYLVLGVLALLAQARQQRWLEALDRRFFRERYDAQRLLREVVEQVRHAGSFERMAPRVVAQIEAALHPEFVALLVRQPRESTYRTLAAAPAGQAPPPLAADSKLMALVRVLGKPLEMSLSSAGWLREQLPHEDTDFVRQARIELLVPIATEPGGTEALLAVGFKRSEEPYTSEDRDLLVAIATSLALLLERPTPPSGALPARVSDSFQECPECGTCYDTGPASCAQDGAPLTPRPLPRLLVARYRLERCLGRGGMGTVYEATDLALERRVAAKLIHDDLVGSASAAERFRREARAAAAFTHPNIVTVHDFGVVAGTRAFLVMELLDGATLRQELRRATRLPASRVREILRGVCEAVEAAHRRQLIHRDLKPENIFLTRAETGEVPKVLDFGVVKSLGPITATGASTQTLVETGAGVLVGTLRYMAPEQLLGEAPQPAWDLWAVAVVTYEMLTGAYPFAGTTRAEWHRAVLSGRFTPLTAHLPAAPARWEEFFARALSPDPKRRPHSARLLFSEFERAVG